MDQIKKVLVLYIGGTIGMQKNSSGVLTPTPNAFLNEVKQHPEMHDSILAKECLDRPLSENELMLPQKDGFQKILYKIIEYSPLLDSSNMTCKDWIRLAKDIEYQYHNYDGFIVLHGTDTLAYTSAALSFMLEGLQKPVILTGSQIPIYESRSDAIDNFAASLVIAGSLNVPEVCVFFAKKLFRGNRIAKMSTEALDAFDSPNYPLLAEVGMEFRVYDHYVKKIDSSKIFKVFADLNPNVAVLSIFPTITSEMLKSFLRLPLEGVVIQSFGTGNIPSNRKDLLKVLKQAIDRHTIIVNITQCCRGTVCSSYETGQVLDEIGIISGLDMTVEAALTKLTYILGLPDLTYSQKTKITRDDLFWKETILPKLKIFYNNYLLPELVDPLHPKGLPIRNKVETPSFI